MDSTPGIRGLKNKGRAGSQANAADPSLSPYSQPKAPAAPAAREERSAKRARTIGENLQRRVDTTLQSVRGPAAIRICTRPPVARKATREEKHLRPSRPHRIPTVPTTTARPPKTRRTTASATHVKRDVTTEANICYPTQHRRTADHKAARHNRHLRAQTSK